MEIPRIEQSLKELSFHLYKRALHPELFKIYRRQQFFQGDYEVNIWITGCSHVVSVFHGDDCMTELICPPEQILPDRCRVEKFVFRGEKQYQCNWSEDFNYMMNFQVENMSSNLYRKTHKDLVKIAKKRGIYVPFPQWTSGELVPFSYIDYEARWEELQLHTFHAYPEQKAIIKTQSLYTMKS